MNAKLICHESEEQCVSEPAAAPQFISTDAVIGVPDDVNLALPQTSSLKRTLQRERRALSLQTDPNVTSTNDRSLVDLYIPESLYCLFTLFDSGPGSHRILMFTNNQKLTLMRDDMRW